MNEIKKIYSRELQKYQQTGDRLFLLGSKYAELPLKADERLKQIPMVYELLRLNNGKYSYISIACNFNLASQFEKSSPEWSLKCIDKAIELDEKTGKNYYLPHLYHFKGRLLYNNNDYKSALDFFYKALHAYDPGTQVLYVASMYNNIGMCYDKMKKVDLAITETGKAIDLLEKKTVLSDAEKVFINYIKGSLAQYFLQANDDKKAEELLSTELNFSLNNRNYRMALYASKELIKLYKIKNYDLAKTEAVINSFKVIEPNLNAPADKIQLYEIALEYYSEKNDIQNFITTSKKLLKTNKENNELIQKELKINFDIADSYIIKSVNNENNDRKKDNIRLIVFVIFLFIIFMIIIVVLFRDKQKKEELIRKEKEISDSHKKILEQNINLQKEKIRNLHLNLNLKTETERAFLENLKKIKRSKNIQPEEILKDLQFKINNLITIDRKGNDLINESSIENQLFMEKLSTEFPFLTAQELKLCVYFKLNLAAKEISLLENLSVGSIRVYKAKIKSRLNLDKENDLSSFLNRF
ncbi:hypothetical protein [Chryseobacterium angstadtii]|nr:hypothetical protein [Chryseobacterium angstadtii]